MVLMFVEFEGGGGCPISSIRETSIHEDGRFFAHLKNGRLRELPHWYDKEIGVGEFEAIKNTTGITELSIFFDEDTYELDVQKSTPDGFAVRNGCVIPVQSYGIDENVNFDYLLKNNGQVYDRWGGARGHIDEFLKRYRAQCLNNLWTEPTLNDDDIWT